MRSAAHFNSSCATSAIPALLDPGSDGCKTFDGRAVPTRRRVYRRNPDSIPDRSVTAITLDIHDVTAA